MEGVKSIDLNFDKGLFTLTVEGKAVFKPSDIKKAVPKRFKVASIDVTDIVGTVKKDGDRLVLTASGVAIVIEKGKGEKAEAAYKDLSDKVAGGKTAFKCSGDLSERKEKKDNKEIELVVLTLSGAAEVEKK